MPLDGLIEFDLPVPRNHLQQVMGAPATLIGHHIDGCDFQFDAAKSGNGSIVFTGTHPATGVAFDVAFDCKGNITGLTQSGPATSFLVNQLSL